MASLIRWSARFVVLALVMGLAAAEVSWMGDRITAHRAAHGFHHGKVINLPLTGFK